MHIHYGPDTVPEVICGFLFRAFDISHFNYHDIAAEIVTQKGEEADAGSELISGNAKDQSRVF